MRHPAGTYTTNDEAARLSGPAWDNSHEYPSLSSRELKIDVARIEELTGVLLELGEGMSRLVPRATTLPRNEAAQGITWTQDASQTFIEAMRLLDNVNTYISCELSVDGRNAEAKALQGKLKTVGARLSQAYNPFEMFLKLAQDEVVETYLLSPKTKPQTFQVMQERKLRDHTLSLPEEDLLIGLAVNGPSAWGVLYDNLSGIITCSIELPEGVKKTGLAEAASLTQSESEATRRAAFQAINTGWQVHEEACAAVLNSLAGWRHEVARRRSYKRPMHFLDIPLHQGRLCRETLEAMMTAVGEAKPLGRQVLSLQARALRKSKLAPWDLFAPCPEISGGTWTKPTFDEAIKLIAKAFATVSPEMGDFVEMMAANRWIEGRIGPTKRPGAYCTEFIKSRSPRVYMTYAGGMREVKTLAHELGHAFHSWVMRDMPIPEISYPMTLAETASLFGETVVNHTLLEQATAPADRLTFLWSAAREVEGFLLNIPVRFEFEKSFYEKRLEKTLAPEDLKGLMNDAWKSWYGDILSEPDPMFWASKLHFSIAEISFYNFPYIFGYLFALGVYAQRAKLGDDFYPAYVALLRDTGRMTTEDLARKHLHADLTKPDFWRESIAIARNTVHEFAKVVDESLPK